MSIYKTSTLLCLAGLLSACGGSIGHETPTPGSGFSSSSVSGASSSSGQASSGGGEVSGPDVLRGAFLDSAVGNLRFSTDSQSGATTDAGEFFYRAGETVTFAIGDLTLPATRARATLTPLDLASTNDLSDRRVINMVRLLISLDVDGDPGNGITLDEQAHGAATALDFDQPAEDFAQSAAVINLLSASGSGRAELVSEGDAMAHFQSTLNGQINSRVIASADGPGDTYELFDAAFGGTAVETPVCDESTDSFGRRITEVMDDDLETYVFAFHILRDVDGDRCKDDINDRQRIEVKTYSPSPEDRIAREGEIHTYRWKFKLPEGFQPSSSFTHIFQIKASGGDDGMPIVTFTPRAGSPERLQVMYAPDGPTGASEVAAANLSDFKGEWVEAYVRTLNAESGRLEVSLTRLSDGQTLVAWSDNDIDMWRDGANLNRPKWGIYRSLNDIAMLRDETVWFNDFCIAEGTNICPSDITGQNPPGGGDVPDFGFEAEALGQAPADFEVEGDITVSDEQAREGSQSVKFSHPEEGQVRMRQAFGVMDSGRLKASVRLPVDSGVDTLLTVYAESYNSANRAIDIILKTDGTVRRREGSAQEDVVTVSTDDWVDIEIQWQSVSTSNEFTLWVNGTEAGTFPVATTGLTPERVEFKFGQNAEAVSPDSVYVDAVTISDQLGEADGGDGAEPPPSSPDFGFEADTLGAAPAGFDAEGDIQVSAEMAREGSQSVKFTHAVDGQVRLRQSQAPAATGSLSAAVYIPAGVDADTLITLYADTYNSANRSIDLLFKGDGTLRRREGGSQEDVTSYSVDAWNEVTVSWEDIAVSNEFTLWLNGVELGTFPVATPNLVPERVEFKFGGNASEISPVSVYLDAVSGF